MGEEIVRLLDLDDSTDTLGRWVSHYLADAIVRAQTDADLQPAVAELIVRVWEHRSVWGSAWPSPEIARVLRWIDRPSRFETSSGSSWGGTLAAVDSLLGSQFSEWMLLAFDESGVPAGGVNPKLEPFLDESEARLVKLLGSYSAPSLEHFGDIEGGDSAAQKIGRVRRQLMETNRRMMELFDDTAKSVLEGATAQADSPESGATT